MMNEGKTDMKRPANVPKTAKYDKEYELWIVTEMTDEYETQYHYSPYDGRLLMILELEN